MINKEMLSNKLFLDGILGSYNFQKYVLILIKNI